MGASDAATFMPSDNDEFPYLETILTRNHGPKNGRVPKTKEPPAAPVVRRRKLGQSMDDNTLLRPLPSGSSSHNSANVSPSKKLEGGNTGKPFCGLGTESRALRLRRSFLGRVSVTPDSHEEDQTEDDTSSEFQLSWSSEVSSDADLAVEGLPNWRSPSKSRSPRGKFGQAETISKSANRLTGHQSTQVMSLNDRSLGYRSERVGSGKRRSDIDGPSTSSRKNTQRLVGKDMVSKLSHLTLDPPDPLKVDDKTSDYENHAAQMRTPPEPTSHDLVSPKKITRIPATPHRPSTDAFWNQEFVNDWNDQHSPRKLLFPDASKSPAKGPSKQGLGGEGINITSNREAKRVFEKAKHAIAASFLVELDETITGGRLAELAVSTGGVKINWSNKLNTTAGRANWRRETVQPKPVDGSEPTTHYRHHASIDLAEKVINDEHRLLNVIAHEFCHLANFMISGVVGNPHGKEFKSWAAKCSRAFRARSIEVTTKHSYDIDFKYVWECVGCATEFKRHSKSINTARQRCGSCKGELRQTKPVPKASAEPSVYQTFVKEQMKILKAENPKSPQKDIMKLVAAKWSWHSKSHHGDAAAAMGNVDDVADHLRAIHLSDRQ